MSTWKAVSSNKIIGICNGRNVDIPRTWSGYRFTDEELTDLFNGKSIKVSATSKRGKTFTASLKIEKDINYNGIVKDRIVPTFEKTFAKDSEPKEAYSETIEKVKEKLEDLDSKTFTTSLFGKDCIVNRIYKGHIFTADEICILNIGGTIVFKDNNDDSIIACKLIKDSLSNNIMFDTVNTY